MGLAVTLLLALLPQDTVAQDTDDSAAYLRAHFVSDQALVAGDLSTAREGFERCLASSPESPTIAYALACVEARAGRPQDSLEHLARAVAWGYVDDAVARWDEDLASVRPETRFQELLAEMIVGRAEDPPPTRQRQKMVHTRTDFPGWASIDRAGSVVVHGDGRGRLHVCEASTGALRRTIDAFDRAVWAMDVSPDGELVGALGYDGTFGIWSTTTEELVVRQHVVPAREDDAWFVGARVEFDPTGARVFAVASEVGGGIWSRSRERVATLDGPLGSWFAWSPDGARLALARGKEVCFIDARTGEPAGSLPCSLPVRAVAFHPQGETLAVGLGAEGRYEVRELASGDVLRSWRIEDAFPTHDVCIPTVRFSPDGRRLAVSSAPGALVEVRNVETGERLCGSGFLGGRMGEPVDVRWADDSRVWYAWLSGTLDHGELDVDSGATNEHEWGELIPEFAENGLGTSAFGEVCVFDADGWLRWARTPLPDGTWILQAPVGYLAGDFTLAEDLVVRATNTGRAQPLTEWIETFYDPKRVRAAAAGIPLLPLPTTR